MLSYRDHHHHGIDHWLETYRIKKGMSLGPKLLTRLKGTVSQDFDLNFKKIFEYQIYLPEFLAQFQLVRARESGAQGALSDEKMKVKNLVTLSP
jgi:hypothetical protein